MANDLNVVDGEILEEAASTSADEFLDLLSLIKNYSAKIDLLEKELKEKNQMLKDSFESDAVYKSILYLLIIISEIEALTDLGIKQDIKYIWTIVGSYFEEAKEIYDNRFSELLKE